VNAVDALVAPAGSSVDPLESFREALVLADQPRARIPRQLVGLALLIGFVAGGTAGVFLAHLHP
jgi:hypothetical protein